MNKKWLLLPALAASLLASTAGPEVSYAADAAYAQLTYNNGGTISMGSSDAALIKNGVSYFSASVAMTAGLELTWDKSGKRAQFSGWDKSIAVRIGSRTGMVDGRQVDMGGAAFMYNKQLYMPAQFLVSALGGGKVRWNPEKKVLLANGLQLFRGYTETFNGVKYGVSKDTGELAVLSSGGKKRTLANLGNSLDLVDFEFERTPGGLLLMKIRNNYGEPHINNQWFTLLLKNGSVIRKSEVGFRASFGEPAVKWNGKFLLNDGKQLRIVEDGSGKVTETIDLAKLIGPQPNPDLPSVIAGSATYNVEGFDQDVALIRRGNNGFLTLVLRGTEERIELYKNFFTKERQQEVELNDAMFPGDGLRYTGRKGDILTFTAYSLSGGKEQKFTFDLSKH